MAAEIQGKGPGTGRTCYFTIRTRTGTIWNTVGAAFEAYNVANFADYDVAMTEQGTASNYYVGNFPTAIVPGVYSIEAKQQAGGTPAETDVTWGTETYQWNGTATFPLSDVATSGQIGQIGPIKLAKGVAVSGFPFKLVSSADHATPFTSGIISGQVSRNGGSFGALQSGLLAAAYTEIGLGWYRCNLTSGDLNADVVALTFSAAGISGGTADQRDFGIIMQRVSGA